VVAGIVVQVTRDLHHCSLVAAGKHRLTQAHVQPVDDGEISQHYWDHVEKHGMLTPS
jgi:hypothetical protein